MCETNLGKKLAAFAAVTSIVCGVVVYTMPGWTVALMEYLTHGKFEYTPKPFDFVALILGAAIWAVIAFLAGILYSAISERIDKK